MENKKITLEIELLEERIAPTHAGLIVSTEASNFEPPESSFGQDCLILPHGLFGGTGGVTGGIISSIAKV